MSDYRTELYDAYDIHTAALDSSDAEKLAWFESYARANYLPHLRDLPREGSTLLEIGCNKGYLLAALRSEGFQELAGIDLAPADLERAREIVPGVSLECTDASAYLRSRRGSFDAIVMKAVLEHVPKDDVIGLLRDISLSLSPRGVALIDVPNMDWLFAAHERYMDFTHEVGFTRESLMQVAGRAFSDVTIVPIVAAPPSRRAALKRRVGTWLLGTLLEWADPEGGGNPIWARGLLAVARP